MVPYYYNNFSYYGDFGGVLGLLWCKPSKIQIFENFVLICGQWPQSYQKKGNYQNLKIQPCTSYPYLTSSFLSNRQLQVVLDGNSS